MGLPLSTCCIGVRDKGCGGGDGGLAGKEGSTKQGKDPDLCGQKMERGHIKGEKDVRRGRRRDGTREKCCDKASQVVVHRRTPHFIRQFHRSPYRPTPHPANQSTLLPAHLYSTHPHLTPFLAAASLQSRPLPYTTYSAPQFGVKT